MLVKIMLMPIATAHDNDDDGDFVGVDFHGFLNRFLLIDVSVIFSFLPPIIEHLELN